MARREELTISDQELLARVEWLIGLRWLAAPAIAVGGSLAVVLLEGWHAAGRLDSPWAFGALVAAYNALLWWGWRRVRTVRLEPDPTRLARLVAHAQIGLDLAVLTAFVARTGGYASPFLGYYVLHTVLASILLSRRAACAWAAVSAGLGLAIVASTGPPGSFGFGPEGLEVGRLPLLLGAGFAMLQFVAVHLATSVVATLRERQHAEQRLLTGIRNQAARLHQANERLEAAQVMQTAYMRRVSHELRSPLAAITTSLEAVREGYAGDISDGARGMVTRSQSRIEQLLRMVNDLLALSRASAGRPKEFLERVSLDAVVEEVLDLLRDRAEGRSIALETDMPHGLPPVLADREGMVQLVTNLTANAIKYSKDGTRVRVAAKAEDGMVVLRVEDQGIGIAEEDLPRLFEEFFRSQNGKAHATVGTGLGLAIVRAIVEQHGGAIEVASQLEVGTTFTARLPVDGPPS